jgi:hypothetical protein
MKPEANGPFFTPVRMPDTRFNIEITMPKFSLGKMLLGKTLDAGVTIASMALFSKLFSSSASAPRTRSSIFLNGGNNSIWGTGLGTLYGSNTGSLYSGFNIGSSLPSASNMPLNVGYWGYNPNASTGATTGTTTGTGTAGTASGNTGAASGTTGTGTGTTGVTGTGAGSSATGTTGAGGASGSAGADGTAGNSSQNNVTGAQLWELLNKNDVEVTAEATNTELHDEPISGKVTLGAAQGGNGKDKEQHGGTGADKEFPNAFTITDTTREGITNQYTFEFVGLTENGKAKYKVKNTEAEGDDDAKSGQSVTNTHFINENIYIINSISNDKISMSTDSGQRAYSFHANA